MLKRTIRTLWFALTELDQVWIPVHRGGLNERHYGGLQGLNKAETAESMGMSQVLVWRRRPDILPPAMSKDDEDMLARPPLCQPR